MKPFVSVTIPRKDWLAIVATAEKVEVPSLAGFRLLVSDYMPPGFIGYTHPDGSMTIVGPEVTNG